ncbi:MAG: hypothetical protein ACP6IS_11130 [Candidatus Asgardarchaeia archaeon]
MSCENCLRKKSCYFYQQLKKLMDDVNGQFRRKQELLRRLSIEIAAHCENFTAYYTLNYYELETAP